MGPIRQIKNRWKRMGDEAPSDQVNNQRVALTNRAKKIKVPLAKFTIQSNDEIK